MSDKTKIGVLGAGTWGVALSRMLYNAGHSVTVWSAVEEEIDVLSKTGRHPNIPDVKLPKQLVYTKEIKTACEGKDLILFAVPSPYVRITARNAAPFITKEQIIVDAAKGIEENTFCTMTEIITEELRNPDVKVVALSGPTHAEEVIKDLPTTIVSACRDTKAAEYVQSVFNTDNMRVYTNDDVHGVELCGALKNIIAVACGIAHGLGCGDNTRAALITRGIAEMSRLGVVMGCQAHTFFGLAGIGDLIVTATSMHSRNFRCGILLGKGLTIKDALQQVGMVVEGINALPAAIQLSQKYNVRMPIVETVNAVVSGNVDVSDVVRLLMSRDLKSEVGIASFNECYHTDSTEYKK